MQIVREAKVFFCFTMGRKANFWLWQRSKSERGLAPSPGCQHQPCPSPLPQSQEDKNPSFHLPSGPGKRRERWTLPPEALPATSSHTYFSCRMKGNSLGSIIFGQPPGVRGTSLKLCSQRTGQQPGSQGTCAHLSSAAHCLGGLGQVSVSLFLPLKSGDILEG